MGKKMGKGSGLYRQAMNINIPRILIGAPKSGSGKTLFTCGLLKYLLEEGKSTQAFKCGPDYIDPMFHRSVIGVPSKNLDAYFMEEKHLKSIFLESAGGKDMAVIEGAMGLFDGLGGIKEDASSYQIAELTKTPVILVVDTYGMGRSIVPLLAGFLQYDRDHLIKGVVLNKTSSMFFPALKETIEKELPVSVLGYFPVQEDMKLESRHLGLMMPHEIYGLKQKTEKAAAILRESMDWPALFEIAGKSSRLCGEEVRMKPVESRVRIGIAMDEAFCFYYEDNLRILEKYGAELCPFSPLRDKTLPDGIKGLILGGGYPELYLRELSANKSMRDAVYGAIKAGMPSLAECGGFMYLHEAICSTDGKAFHMAGVLPGICKNTGKLVRFGYVELDVREEGLLLEQNQKIRGHEFHYYDSSDNGCACLAEKPAGSRSWECIHAGAGHFWGFPHLHYDSNLMFPSSFLKKAAAWRSMTENHYKL